jgi:L-malate glycosyltransferase
MTFMDNNTESFLHHSSITDFESVASPSLPGPVFLMVNTLETGGTERQFVVMTRALRAHGNHVHLGCVRNRGRFADELGDLAEFRLGGSSYGLQSIRSRWSLARHLRKLGVVIAHAFDFYSNLTLVPAAKLAGLPAIIGSHRQIGDLLTTTQFRAQLAVFHLCDRVLCNSRAAAERLLQAGLPDRKLVVIGNALPAEAFVEVRDTSTQAKSGIRVGMIARMNAEYKNHRGFLRAAKVVADRFAQVNFVLVGDGALRRELEAEAAQLGLGDRVEFLGDRRDVPAVLASLDVSVVPSASESLSNVMLESMAAGVAVVATAVGGNREIGDGGRSVLVPASDEAALADGLSRVVQDSALRTEMAREGRAFVRAKFSAGQICQQYENLYVDVISGRRRSESRGRFDLQFSPDSKIRVALVAPTLRYVGGQSVQADLLMRNWAGDRDIAVTHLPIDPRFPVGLRWAECVPFLRTLLRQPIYAWNLWRDLKDIDVVHVFSASYTSFLLAPLPAWFIARMRAKKTLINYHSGEARSHLHRSKLARGVLRRTDDLVVPSGYLEEVFLEFGLKAQTVPNIIDLSQFYFRDRRPLQPHLLCTRGFHPYYGIDVVVRAFAEVKKTYSEARLDLVGGGSLEASIRDLVRQLRLSNVNFIGVVSRDAIGRAYDRGDIFVNASNLDNMPVSVLEAFAAGTPVITTEPEGMRYIVQHERTGLLSSPGDPAALAQNIIRVLKEPQLAERLAQNAFEESKRYRWTAVREHWLSVYEGLVAHRRASQSLEASTEQVRTESIGK